MPVFLAAASKVESKLEDSSRAERSKERLRLKLESRLPDSSRFPFPFHPSCTVSLSLSLSVKPELQLLVAPN